MVRVFALGHVGADIAVEGTLNIAAGLILITRISLMVSKLCFGQGE